MFGWRRVFFIVVGRHGAEYKRSHQSLARDALQSMAILRELAQRCFNLLYVLSAVVEAAHEVAVFLRFEAGAEVVFEDSQGARDVLRGGDRPGPRRHEAAGPAIAAPASG